MGSKSPDSLGKLIGQGISGIRRQRGWNQEKLAEEAKISASSLKKIETGAQWPTEKNMSSILIALNTTLGEVADFTTVSKAHHPEVMDQVKALRQALTLVEASVDQKVFREMERRTRQAEPVVRAYKALEERLGHELMERLKIANGEDVELLKATLPKLKETRKNSKST